MKKISPIIAGWICGAAAATVVMMTVAVATDLTGNNPRFSIASIPIGFIFLYISVFITMIPGLAIVLPIFYLTKLREFRHSWILVGILGIIIMLLLLWTFGAWIPSQGFRSIEIAIAGSFVAASTFWLVARRPTGRKTAEQGAAANP